MLPIFKKELKSTLKTPLSYIVLAIFIGILNFLFIKSFFLEKVLSMRYYFDLLIWFLIIIIPALSMRVLSDEFKSGTIEFLLTKPISICKIIGGKFLSLIAYFILFILSGVILYASLSFLGNFDGGVVFTQFTGLVFLSIGMFAISFFASSITSNQIFAFMISVFINFLLILFGLDFIQLSLPNFLSNILVNISFLYHFDNFLKGLISLSDVFYFLTLVFGCLYFSYLSISRFQRTGKVGISLFKGLEIILVLGIFVFVNLIIGKLNFYADFTNNKVYTISDATKEILKNTNDLVDITFYTSTDLPPQLKGKLQQASDLINQFNKYSGNNLIVKTIHPIEDQKENDAMMAGIAPIQIQVIENDQFGVKKGFFGMTIQHGGEKEVLPYLGDSENLEHLFISKILRLTSKEKKSVFLVSTDDIDNKVIENITQKIGKDYDINTQKIFGSGESLNFADNKIWFILKGDNDFPENVYSQIKENIGIDKTMILFFQSNKITTEGGLTANKNESKMHGFLKDNFGVSIGEGIVGDVRFNSNISFRNGFITYNMPYNYFPRVFPSKDTPVGQGADNIIMPFSSSISGSSSSFKTTDILKASEFAFEDKDISNLSPEKDLNLKKEDLKEYVMARSFTQSGFILVLVPNTHLFDFVQGRDIENNMNFTANLIDLYGGDKRLIGIRAKNIEYPVFEADNDVKMWIKAINIYVFPILLVLIGTIISLLNGFRRK